MRQCADGNEIHAGFSDATNRLKVHAAAGFEDDAVSPHRDRGAKFVVRHVIQQDNVNAFQANKARDLIERVGFDFDSDFRALLQNFLNGMLQRAVIRRGGKVVVLDEDLIIEADSMIRPAACEHGGFFEQAKAGSGFASVEQARGGSSNGICVSPSQRGDAGEALKEI